MEEKHSYAQGRDERMSPDHSKLTLLLRVRNYSALGIEDL